MLQKNDEPVPGYRLADYLGRGQFGEVWECFAPGGTRVALKFVSLEHAGGLTEFRSIQRMKEVRHPHLMPITALWLLDEHGQPISDFDTQAIQSTSGPPRETLQPDMHQDPMVQPKMLILAMLRADMHLGDRLEQCQQAGLDGIPAEELLRYMEEAAKGIDFLNESRHDLGDGPIAIQHCDIKPANMLLLGGSVMIADFGISRILTDVQSTATSMTGTPAYMSPESIRRRPGRWTDQYSLAITYVELRTGKLPFKEMETFAVLEANRDGELELSGLPPAEREVIRRATSLLPEDRYPTTQAMAEALRQAVSQDGAVVPAQIGRQKQLVLWSIPIILLCALVIYLVVQRPWEGFTAGPAIVDHGEQPAGSAGIDPTPEQGSDKTGGTGGDSVAESTSNNGQSAPLTPVARSLTIKFEPADCEIEIDEKPLSLTPEGELTLELLPDQQLRVVARHPSGDYLPIDEILTAESLEQNDLTLRLDFTAEYHFKSAKTALAAGERATASQAFLAALELDSSLLSLQPIELKKQELPIDYLAVTRRWVISASSDGEVGFWELSSVAKSSEPVSVVRADPGQSIESLSISEDGSLAVAGGYDGQLWVWDLTQDDPSANHRQLVDYSPDIVDVAVNHATNVVVTAASDQSVRTWTLTPTGLLPTECVLEIQDDEFVHIAMSGDGRWLVAALDSGRVVSWDLTSNDVQGSFKELLPSGHLVEKELVLSDHRWVLTGDSNGRLSLMDLTSSSSDRVQGAIGSQITALIAETVSGPFLSGSSDGSVRFWRREAAELVPETIGLHAGDVTQVSLSASGKLAASAGLDGYVFFWDFARAESWQSPMPLQGDGQELKSVAISPDEQWLVTAGVGGRIWLWSIPHCRLLLDHQDFELPPGGPSRKIEARRRSGLRRIAMLTH